MLDTLHQFVSRQEGADQLVVSALFSDLMKDLQKICVKQGYERELNVVNTLHMSYSDFLLAEGMELGMEKGMEKGREEGELQKQREIAKKMLGRFFVDDIAEMTGLPIEEIQALEEGG